MRSMKRGVKKQNNYRFNHNTIKNKWKSEKKQRHIENAQIDKAWEKNKTAKQNLDQMGLVYDLNKAIKVGKKKEKTPKEKPMEVQEKKSNTAAAPSKNTPTKPTQVVKELEEEANQPQSKTLRLSQPDIRYCIYMMEKYVEDYESMAKDPKNIYQDTPAQIKHKILTFKSVPVQYNAYLRSKGENGGGSTDSMDTS